MNLPNTIFDQYYEQTEQGYKEPLVDLLLELWAIAEKNGQVLNYAAKVDVEGQRREFEELGRKTTEMIIAYMELRIASPTTVTTKFAQDLADKSGLMDWLYNKI